jgi:hypothetical protein
LTQGEVTLGIRAHSISSALAQLCVFSSTVNAMAAAPLSLRLLPSWHSSQNTAAQSFPASPTLLVFCTPCRTEVEEAKDQSGISADLVVDLVPFDKLTKHIGRKVSKTPARHTAQTPESPDVVVLVGLIEQQLVLDQ